MPGDGYSTYQYIELYGRRLRTEKEKVVQKADWDAMTFANMLSRKQQEDPSAQYVYAAILLEKGTQLGKSAREIFDKWISSNVEGFKIDHLNNLKNDAIRKF